MNVTPRPEAMVPRPKVSEAMVPSLKALVPYSDHLDATVSRPRASASRPEAMIHNPDATAPSLGTTTNNPRLGDPSIADTQAASLPAVQRSYAFVPHNVILPKRRLKRLDDNLRETKRVVSSSVGHTVAAGEDKPHSVHARTMSGFPEPGTINPRLLTPNTGTSDEGMMYLP